MYDNYYNNYNIMQTIKHEAHARNEQEIQDFDIEQVASGSAGATMRSPASA